MGLSPNVLQTLLITEDDNERTALAIATPAAPVHDNAGRIQDAVDQGDVLEFEFESDESPPTLSTGVIPSAPHLPSSRAKEVIIDPILDDGPGDEGSSRRSAEAGPSSLPIRSTAHSQHRKFRLRLLSESSPAAVPVRPIGVTEMMRIHVDRNRDLQEKSKRRRHSSDYHGKGRKVRSVVADGHGSIKAEYVLAGESYLRSSAELSLR